MTPKAGIMFRDSDPEIPTSATLNKTPTKKPMREASAFQVQYAKSAIYAAVATFFSMSRLIFAAFAES